LAAALKREDQRPLYGTQEETRCQLKFAVYRLLECFSMLVGIQNTPRCRSAGTARTRTATRQHPRSRSGEEKSSSRKIAGKWRIAEACEGVCCRSQCSYHMPAVRRKPRRQSERRCIASGAVHASHLQPSLDKRRSWQGPSGRPLAPRSVSN